MAGRHRGPADEQRALDAYIKLMRSTNHLESWLAKRLHGSGITIAQLAVLECLMHCGPLSQTELGSKMLRSGGSVTSLVDHLERKEWVRRVRSEVDRRVVHVHLTEEGSALIEEVFPAHARDITQALGALERGEMEALSELCKKLGQAVAEQEA